MKINEIIIKEDPPISADPTPVSKNLDKTSGPSRPGSAQGSWDKGYTQQELTNMRQAYRGDPEFVNFVQYALLMPHINSMSQAISYANTELAARQAKGQGLPSARKARGDIVKKTGKGMSGPLNPRGPGFGIGKEPGISRATVGDSIRDMGASGIPGLDLVKQAGAKIVDYVGDTAQKAAGVKDKDLVSYSQKVGDFVGSAKQRGIDVAKDIRG